MLWKKDGNLIQLLIATHHAYESRFFIPFNTGVDKRDIEVLKSAHIKLHSCIQEIY